MTVTYQVWWWLKQRGGAFFSKPKYQSSTSPPFEKEAGRKSKFVVTRVVHLRVSIRLDSILTPINYLWAGCVELFLLIQTPRRISVTSSLHFCCLLKHWIPFPRPGTPTIAPSIGTHPQPLPGKPHQPNSSPIPLVLMRTAQTISSPLWSRLSVPLVTFLWLAFRFTCLNQSRVEDWMLSIPYQS